MHDHAINQTHDHGEGLIDMFVEVMKHAVMITFFVIVMMIVIEFINVQSKGKWNKSLKGKGWLQIVLASFLGIMPGCLGSFAAVSLYVHRALSFAALVAVMIASSGDEIFIMFAMIPDTTLILLPVMLVIAILSGLLLSTFVKGNLIPEKIKLHPQFHQNDPNCVCFDSRKIVSQLKNASFHRALLIFGFTSFLIFLSAGEIGPSKWNWEKITFLIITVAGGFVVSTASDHFLTEHIWHHIIKKHFVKIFLWTFGAFVLIHLLDEYIDVEEWIKSNSYIILIIAVLIGIIPESGPHIVFISLFASGSIPFSILLANSIVQDGHGAIPLLAESRRSFVWMKLVNAAVGLIVGGGLLLLGI
jgi:hypothetical protein